MAESSSQLREFIFTALSEDPQFRPLLLNNPIEAIKTKISKMKLRVIEAKPGEWLVFIPYPTETVRATVAKITGEIPAGAAPNRTQFECLLMQKAWDDPKFLKRLTNATKETLTAEVASYGGTLPDNIKVQLYTESADECLVVIPAVVAYDISTELTEDELEAVAGGEGVSIGAAVGIAVVSATAGAVAEAIVTQVMSSGSGSGSGSGS